MTQTIEQAIQAKKDKAVYNIVSQVRTGLHFDFVVESIKERSVFKDQAWEEIVSRAKVELNPDFAKMIEQQFPKNFYRVEQIGESWTGNGTLYFTAISNLFNDKIEIRMTSDGQLFARMHLEEFDYDFEMEGVTDEYAYFGTLNM